MHKRGINIFQYGLITVELSVHCIMTSLALSCLVMMIPISFCYLVLSKHFIGTKCGINKVSPWQPITDSRMGGLPTNLLTTELILIIDN